MPIPHHDGNTPHSSQQSKQETNSGLAQTQGSSAINNPSSTTDSSATAVVVDLATAHRLGDAISREIVFLERLPHQKATTKHTVYPSSIAWRFSPRPLAVLAPGPVSPSKRRCRRGSGVDGPLFFFIISSGSRSKVFATLAMLQIGRE
jgi:hypothetical protein